MKRQIPEDRTKAYWEDKVPNPCGNKKVKFIYLRNSFFFMLILTLFVFWSVWDGLSFQAGIVVITIWFAYVLVAVISAVVSEKLPKWRIRKNHGKDPVLVNNLIFYQMKIVWGTINSSAPQDDPVNKLYPEDMLVFRFMLYYKLNGKKRVFGNKQYLNCLGTQEKYEELERLLHMKETAVLRKESRVLKVTYTKYNKELVKIEKAEGETYPIHCDYEELLERINIMF